MLVGCEDSNCFDFETSLKDAEVSREASNYIINNYTDLINLIKHYGIKEKSQDLLHDVYVSIVSDEDNGEGFDMCYGNNNSIMLVSQFVIGRIKLYSKNLKYKTNCVEAAKTTVKHTNIENVPELDTNGQIILDKNGKIKYRKEKTNEKIELYITSNAASFNEGGDVMENNDDFQRAFALASVKDTTADIAEVMSLREQIDFCVDVCNLHEFNLMNVFKNMDKLANMLGDTSKKKKTSESVFNKLTEIVNNNDEFASTLMDILKYSSRDRSSFERIIATY